MTVAELRRILGQCKPDSEVLIRLDDEFFEHPSGNVAEILGHEYSYGCTESLTLMLECGQPDAQIGEGREKPSDLSIVTPHRPTNHARPEEDEMVIEALKEGRQAEDILLLDCPMCGWTSYWNEGSHATCRNCGCDLIALVDAGEVFTLADYWTTAPYPCDEPAI